MNATKQTNAETANFEIVERYLREMLAKPSSLTDDERTLIAGNIRGFYAAVFPFGPSINAGSCKQFKNGWCSCSEDCATVILKEAETAIEEYSCRTPVPHIAAEMEALASRIRWFLTAKRPDAQKYLDALESIDAVAVDFGHFESAARTMQEIARKAIAGVRS